MAHQKTGKHTKIPVHKDDKNPQNRKNIIALNRKHGQHRGIGDMKRFNRQPIHPYFVVQEPSKTYNLVCVPCEDSDKPTFLCSLIRDFARSFMG